MRQCDTTATLRASRNVLTAMVRYALPYPKPLVLWASVAGADLGVLEDEAQAGDRTRHIGDRTRKDGGSTPDSTALVESLREQVEYLKETVAMRDEEIRRRDHLLAAALERIPAIEAPPEATGGPETASEEPYTTHAPPEAYGPPEQRKRSWWREFLGME